MTSAGIGDLHLHSFHSFSTVSAKYSPFETVDFYSQNVLLYIYFAKHCPVLRHKRAHPIAYKTNSDRERIILLEKHILGAANLGEDTCINIEMVPVLDRLDVHEMG